ncbi:MAG: IS110 family transposase [Propionibacteriaceae bacterium]|jgi:transposase|nr:IS110 family transposase [Propionibacteriaceae bacterium]
MKKHRYSATNIKQADWKQIGVRTAGERVVLGVDVAKDEFFGVLMGEDLAVSATLKWKHPEQTRALGAHLIEEVHADRLEVAMEPSGTYGDALYRHLSELGIPIYRVSPKRVHDAAEVYDGVPSLHDAKSAYIIARLHRDGGSSLWEAIPEQRRNRKALIAELDLYQDQQQRNLNRLEALLNRHWPEAVRVMELKRVSLLCVLAEYGDPATITAHSEAAWELMRHSGRGLLSAETIEQLLACAQDTLGVPCTAGERHLLRVLAEELLRTHRQIKRIEAQIDQEVHQDALLTRLAAVTGKTTSLVLEAALGSPLDYPNPHSYLKAMGLNLKERSSGKHKGQLKITKRGPGIVRKYQYFTALRWLYQDPVIALWYRNKVRRDGDRKGKAIVAVMRKLALSLWYVARGEVFDSRKLFNVRAFGRVQ